MNNCRSLTRRERAQNIRILNGLTDLPANHQDSRILAYGRAPFPLIDQHDEAARTPIPGQVNAWGNSPAARSKRLDRLAGRVEPILVALLLVLCSLLLALSVSTRLIVK